MSYIIHSFSLKMFNLQVIRPALLKEGIDLVKRYIPLLTTLRMCFIRYNSWRNMLLNVLPSPILHLFQPIS